MFIQMLDYKQTWLGGKSYRHKEASERTAAKIANRKKPGGKR